MQSTVNKICSENVRIRHMGLQQYEPILQQLKLFTHNRSAHTTDEIWVLEHSPVYTQGQAGKPEHILNPGNIPVVQSDRGGQVTYHGPGQLIVYFLVDLQRKKLTVRNFIDILELSVIDLLTSYNIVAEADKFAPGVYVNQAKICSLGLRVRQGCTYHGLSLNVNMDLEPFSRINPCGFANMQITQISEHRSDIEFDTIMAQLLKILSQRIGYD